MNSNKKINFNNNPEEYSEQQQVDSPISQIFNLKITQKTLIQINFTLQIIGIKELNNLQSNKDINKNKEMLCLNLSDNFFFYNGFLVSDKNAFDLYDIVEIHSLNVVPTQRQKLFVIKNFRVIDKANGVVGNPINIAKFNYNNSNFNGQSFIKGKINFFIFICLFLNFNFKVNFILKKSIYFNKHIN